MYYDENVPRSVLKAGTFNGAVVGPWLYHVNKKRASALPGDLITSRPPEVISNTRFFESGQFELQTTDQPFVYKIDKRHDTGYAVHVFDNQGRLPKDFSAHLPANQRRPMENYNHVSKSFWEKFC